MIKDCSICSIKKLFNQFWERDLTLSMLCHVVKAKNRSMYLSLIHRWDPTLLFSFCVNGGQKQMFKSLVTLNLSWIRPNNCSMFKILSSLKMRQWWDLLWRITPQYDWETFTFIISCHVNRLIFLFQKN